MGISASRKVKWQKLSEQDCIRIIRMALEDRTAFEDIQKQFDLSPNETVLFMRSQLKPSSFRLWRKRVSEQGHLKNQKKMRAEDQADVDRFKCRTQRSDGSIKNRK